MKNTTFKIFFGLFLIFTVSAVVFGQENKDTVSTSDEKNNQEAKQEEKKEPLKLEDCIPQDYDCKIAYYTEKIDYFKKNKYIRDESRIYIELRGITYYEKGDYRNALDDFNNLITDRSYNIQPLIYRGKIYEKKGNYELALKDYFRFSSNEEALLGIGNIYRYKREYEKALKNYNQAIFLNSRLSKALFGRAVIYLELGKILNRSDAEEDKLKAIQYFKDALKDLDSVIEIDLLATEPETYLRRSQVYRQLGETEKADADFKKYNELDEASKIKSL